MTKGQWSVSVDSLWAFCLSSFSVMDSEEWKPKLKIAPFYGA